LLNPIFAQTESKSGLLKWNQTTVYI